MSAFASTILVLHFQKGCACTHFTNFVTVVFVEYKQHLSVTSSNGQVLTYRSSQKGRLQLSCDGFYYVKEKTVKQKEYWRCIYYTTKIKCHGRLHTLNGEIHHSTPHNHFAGLFKRSDYSRLSEIIINPDTASSEQATTHSIHIESVTKVKRY